MKKVLGLLLLVVLAVLVFSGTAQADTDEYPVFTQYEVVKGDTFWGIAKKFAHGRGHLYPIIMNDNGWTKSPTKLGVRQLLKIREFESDVTYIINHNNSPFGAKAEKGNPKVLKSIKGLPYSAEVKEAAIAAITHLDPEAYVIERGEKFDCMTDKKGLHCDGPYEIAGTEEIYQSSAWKITASGQVCVLPVKFDCGNLYTYCEEITQPIEEAEEVETEEEEIEKKIEPELRIKEIKEEKKTQQFPPVPIFPGVEKQKTFPPVPVYAGQPISKRDQFDAYIGAGNYSSSHHRQSANGYYYWGKARYRPFWMRVGEKTELGLGVFAFGAGGAGNSEEFRYHWQEGVLGLTGKLIGPHYDTDLDVGRGFLKNWGGEDKYRSHQNEKITLISAHLNEYSNRDAGLKLLPKKEFNIELRLTDRTHHEHSWNGNNLEPEPFNNKRLDLSYTQWIYDFEPNSHTRITPGWNFGGGREYGLRKNYLQTGPAVVFSSFNQDIIQLNVLNYKEQLKGKGDQWHWISGWINLYGSYKAIRASQMHKTTPEELKARAVKINTNNTNNDEEFIRMSDFN